MRNFLSKIQSLLFIVSFLAVSIAATAQDAPFITVWQTDNPGTSEDNQITIPGTGTDYLIEWEEVGNEASNSGSETGTNVHTVTFPSVGTYRLKISGDFTRINFNLSGDNRKILDVSQWGDIVWTSFEGAFQFCSNLNFTAIDAPNLSIVTNMDRMFIGATKFNSDINHWDVSGITSMSFMFASCSSFNQTLSLWDVSNVKIINKMFTQASSFDQSLEDWRLINVEDISNMFNYSGLSNENYESTLLGWSQVNDLPIGLTLGAASVFYCETIGREVLINQFSWSILGDIDICGDAFITTWQTDNPGETNDNQIYLPLFGNKYLLKWENVNNNSDKGVFEASGDTTLSFQSAGTYRILITGDFDRIYQRSSNDKYKLIELNQWGDIKWNGLDYAFERCDSMMYRATDIPDLSDVTNLSGMFYLASKFNGDISNWDVSSINDMSYMFFGARSFNQNLSSWNVSNVTNMSYMFSNTYFNQNIGAWNVSNVVDFSSMFFNNPAFNQDLSSWDVSSVEFMQSMFQSATLFNGDISSWDVSSVSNMNRMFASATLFNGNLGTWNVSNVTNMSDMFLGVESFNQDISNWDVSNVTNMSGMFRSAEAFNQNIGAWNVSNVTNMSVMFNGAESFNQDISNWDVSNVTDMSGMFRSAEAFNQNIGAWNVSSVRNMISLFKGASDFNQDLNNWDVSNVTDMSEMFEGASTFNGDVSDWNVSNVENMSAMFRGASEFNSDLSNWDVSNVTNMKNMFRNASSFNSDLNSWDVSNVGDMSSMFSDANSFNGSLSSWNVSNVERMEFMFENAVLFNGDISSWDVSNVSEFSLMFGGATSFDQNLGKWNISEALDMSSMFYGTALSTANYDYTLIGWSQLENLKTDVYLGAGGLSYCLGKSSRDFLINEKGWIILSDSENCESTFISNWNSGNEGDSESNQVTIPANGGDYLILWEDINNTAINGLDSASGYHNIDFPVSGNYRLKIFGDLNSINFSDLGDKLKITEIQNWGDIQWTNLNGAFAGAENLTITANDAPDLSQVTDMSRMFYNAKSMNQDISHWNVSSVSNMSDLFHGASAFNQDLSTWDVSNVTNMSRMFASATAFNQDLTDWNTANVTNMDFMFWDADSFQGDISSWDVANVNNMWGMFYSADSVNSDISNWDVSSVTNMTEMFREAKTFNQDISSWNTANVTDISGMFYEATSFDQDLGDWHLSNAGSLFEFLTNSGLSVQNYDATLEGWATNANIPSDIALSAEGLIYCASDEYRQQLIDDFGWGITGDIPCSLVLEETFPAAEATNVEKDTEIYLTFDQTFEEIDFSNIELSDISGNSVTINGVVADSLTLRIIHNGLGFNTYEVTIPENTLMSASGKVNDEIKWSFATQSILAAKDKQLATNLANYPNPFSDYTTLTFSLTEGNSFDLLVYDVKGQLVRQQSFDNRSSGEQSIKFERKGLPTGLYHYQIQSANRAVSGKMMIK